MQSVCVSPVAACLVACLTACGLGASCMHVTQLLSPRFWACAHTLQVPIMYTACNTTQASCLPDVWAASRTMKQRITAQQRHMSPSYAAKHIHASCLTSYLLPSAAATAFLSQHRSLQLSHKSQGTQSVEHQLHTAADPRLTSCLLPSATLITHTSCKFPSSPQQATQPTARCLLLWATSTIAQRLIPQHSHMSEAHVASTFTPQLASPPACYPRPR
jgi:hypothetical protein